MNISAPKSVQCVAMTVSSFAANAANIYGQWHGSGTTDAGYGDNAKFRIINDSVIIGWRVQVRNNGKLNNVVVHLQDNGANFSSDISQTIATGFTGPKENYAVNQSISAGHYIAVNFDSSACADANTIGFLVYVYYREK